MTIRPIRTDDDLRAAYRRIEALWQAKPGTPEGDEKEVWYQMVERYEALHHPMPPVDPIEFLSHRARDLEVDMPELGVRAGLESARWEALQRGEALTVAELRALASAAALPVAELLGQPTANDREWLAVAAPLVRRVEALALDHGCGLDEAADMVVRYGLPTVTTMSTARTASVGERAPGAGERDGEGSPRLSVVGPERAAA